VGYTYERAAGDVVSAHSTENSKEPLDATLRWVQGFPFRLEAVRLRGMIPASSCCIEPFTLFCILLGVDAGSD
jgi:hypothetical protein